MLIASFTVDVVQGVIAVFAKDVDSPFNDWSKDAYRQGFSWRPHSVSFRTFEDCDVARIPVRIFLETAIQVRADAIRALVVPFEVIGSGLVEVSGVYEKDGNCARVPPGRYALLFQLGYSNLAKRGPEPNQHIREPWCDISFVPSESAEPAILRQDPELAPPDPLAMDGAPA
jgi:hypothetical protein